MTQPRGRSGQWSQKQVHIHSRWSVARTCAGIPAGIVASSRSSCPETRNVAYQTAWKRRESQPRRWPSQKYGRSCDLFFRHRYRAHVRLHQKLLPSTFFLVISYGLRSSETCARGAVRRVVSLSWRHAGISFFPSVEVTESMRTRSIVPNRGKEHGK